MKHATRADGSTTEYLNQISDGLSTAMPDFEHMNLDAAIEGLDEWDDPACYPNNANRAYSRLTNQHIDTVLTGILGNRHPSLDTFDVSVFSKDYFLVNERTGDQIQGFDKAGRSIATYPYLRSLGKIPLVIKTMPTKQLSKSYFFKQKGLEQYFAPLKECFGVDPLFIGAYYKRENPSPEAIAQSKSHEDMMRLVQFPFDRSYFIKGVKFEADRRGLDQF